ncbi:probable pectinesterase 29 [Phtheirospermum japonicum]|uniref:Pectinesterase n=1 Tax=Phtheirospermum japonicum TaxID=374723 RepID=A0A830C167_9LAMI|nr:probable pectinesterase 29 [Phtheirospermum japonicum]
MDVDPTSRTSFSTIQSAIDRVPSHNNKWIFITVKAGVYKEQVKIPRDKPFLYLKGEGKGKTKVVWGAHATMLTSTTFASMADNIVVSGITFVNSYNYPPKKKGSPVKQAVAARIAGDKSAFYECSFLGYQDTLLDDKGRHFFKRCKIVGAVDFIFGRGQSIYEKCSISMIAGNVRPSSTGYIAAQARASQKDDSGFVFKHCNVTGKGNIFLGRAWKSYSRVIYYNSFFAGTVVPQGWDAWDHVGQENQLTFAEHECHGPGSDMSKRVKWEKKLIPEELKFFISKSYIDNEGWMHKLPLSMKDD